MMVMSVDQSLNCSGVFIWDKGEYTFHKVIKPKDIKADQVIRIREMVAELKRLVNRFDVREVVIESLPYGVNSTSVRPLAALYYFIHSMCIDMDIKFSEANVTAVKKFATGKGNAKKVDMIEAFKFAAPKIYTMCVIENIRKTTGLSDISDSFHIGQFYLSRRNDA